MNERNVAALARILADVLTGAESNDEGEARDQMNLAGWLAARGVLVPAALTDEQAWAVGDDKLCSPAPEHMPEVARTVRAFLASIATGEQP